MTHLFGVLEVLKQSLLVPSDALVHIRSSIRETLALARLTAKHTAHIK